MYQSLKSDILAEDSFFYMISLRAPPRPDRDFFFHILDFYSSGDVSVGLEWVGAGGGGSIEHKGQEDVSRLLLAVYTHNTVGKTFE